MPFFLLLFAFKNLKAQYLEFVENKGQWDTAVKFKGDMGAGAFFLQKDGYKVLLNNPQDLQAIADYFGGHHLSNSKTAAKSSANTGKLILHSHAYEMKFAGASPNVQIIPEKPENTYNNYFIGKDKSKWTGHCNVYQAITYKNIYPNIDARYYTNNGKATYDLIVHPGGDVAKIALQFNGVDGLNVKNRNLIIKNSIGDVTELSPETYQLDEKGKTNVETKYVIIGNTVRFKVSNYSKNATLVIDPTLIFSTFTGSAADNWGYTATYDGQGDFYAGGIAFSDGYPTYVGSYQQNFQGGDNSENGEPSGYDAAIIKFSSNGSQRVYATYLGGSGDEQPHSLVVANDGNLIVAGRTHSLDFPSTNKFGPGATSAISNFNIYITKFNADGSGLIGSAIIGGTGIDGVNIQPKYPSTNPAAISIRRNYGDDARSEVIVDASDNIYLASCTQSEDFPVTPNAFQTSLKGFQDGVIIKATPDLSNVIFSSYIGGDGDDAAFVLALNPTNNNIYFGGGTTSINFPGAINTYSGGVCDGYIAIIDNNNYSLIKSAYEGTGGNDLVYGVQFDKLGFPYIMGTTTGSWPIINAAYSVAAGKQFIAKLKPDLSVFMYSTVFGSSQPQVDPNISPVAFLVDRCENVYVSGWGGGIDPGDGYPNSGTGGLPVTSGAIKSTTDGADFYFFVLKKDATAQLYGSFFGETGGQLGEHVDGGTSRFDKQGVIYQGICANCEGPPGIFPVTPGVWSQTNQALASGSGAGCNMAAVKIAFELAGVGAAIRASINGVPRDTSGCIPLTVNFTDTLNLGKKFIWNFGDGSPDVTTIVDSISHTYNNIGNYRVRLISIDSTTCNISDTAYATIRARNDEAPVAFTQLKLPPCDSLKYQFNNTSIAPAGKPFSSTSFTWDFGDGTTLVSNATNVFHNYTSSGTYIVKLNLTDTNYCNAPDAAVDTLRIAVNVKAQFETPPSGCAPYDAVFNNTSLAGQQFFWDFGDGSTSTEVSPTHPYPNPGTYTINLIVIDTSTCNKTDSTKTSIVVSAKPTAGFSFAPVTPQANTFIKFTNFSTGGSLFKWTFGDGDTLITVQIDTTVKHIYNKTGTYNVCLIAYNNYGCTDTSCHPVQAIIIPLLDVPNAFTPNGDGINDAVYVRGFGIDKMNWKIYNRWGTQVFQSVSQNFGWDGKYKGILQPQEVYTYVLDVQFSDGTNYRKTGDITLLR